QTKHLTRMLDDLLDVSRITRGTIQLRKEPVEFVSVLTRAVETVRPLIEAKDHHLTLSIAGGPFRLSADPTRLEQVLVNLVTNAVKYTEEGGHITLTADHNGEVIVTVRDDGIGIPPEMLSHIFDLFVQAERPIDRSGGGLGIGLT